MATEVKRMQQRKVKTVASTRTETRTLFFLGLPERWPLQGKPKWTLCLTSGLTKRSKSSAVTYARAENWQAETSQREPRKESEVEAAICASLKSGKMGQAYWQLEDPKAEMCRLEKQKH